MDSGEFRRISCYYLHFTNGEIRPIYLSSNADLVLIASFLILNLILSAVVYDNVLKLVFGI